jgi:hypothetical protein
MTNSFTLVLADFLFIRLEINLMNLDRENEIPPFSFLIPVESFKKENQLIIWSTK